MDKKKIFITGGTGFIGRELSKHLVSAGHNVSVLSRFEKRPIDFPEEVRIIKGDPKVEGPWQMEAQYHNWIINLVGESIFGRWTQEKKKKIYESRILSTRNLVNIIKQAKGDKEITLLSTSAVGYYGFHQDEIITEADTAGDDWLSNVAVQWESEAMKAQEKGIRVLITRFGLVLGKKGGMLDQLIPLYKFCFGGPIGNGKQWFSWAHIDDIIEGILFVLNKPEIEGPVNITSPNPVRNKEFSKILGNVMNRPAFLPTPGFLLKIIYGEFGNVIVEGQRVIPKKLLDMGYNFNFPDLRKALQNILKE